MNQKRKPISNMGYFRYSGDMPRASKPEPGPLSLEIASLLRAEMGKQSMNKTQLATESGLNRTMVSDIVRGLQQADIEQLDDICQALGLNLTQTIGKAEAATDSRRLL